MSDSLVLIPAGIPLALMSPLGDLLDAAMGGGTMLGVGTHPGISAELRPRDDIAVSEIADRLRAASAAVRGEPYTPAPDPGDDVDGVKLGHLREHSEGGLTVGVGGYAAEDQVKLLLAAMLPALDAAGATNYVEWQATARPQRADDGTPGMPERFVIIVCRPGGKTPHQLRKEADETRDRAVEALGRLDMALWERLGWLADEEPTIPRGEDQREALLSRASAAARAGRAEPPMVAGACAAGTCSCDTLGETADA